MPPAELPPSATVPPQKAGKIPTWFRRAKTQREELLKHCSTQNSQPEKLVNKKIAAKDGVNCSNSTGKAEEGKAEKDKKVAPIEMIKAADSTTSIRESCESKKAAKKSAEKMDEKIIKVLASQSGRVTRPPQKSNRGRKAVDIDEYI